MPLLRTLILPTLLLLWSFAAKAQHPDVIPGDVLVMLQFGAVIEDVTADPLFVNGERIELLAVEEVSIPLRVWLLRFDANKAGQVEVLRAVRSHPAVQLAQSNHHVKQRNLPNDSNYGNQWHHQNIGSEAAWDISTGGLTATGDTIVVCIIENSDLPHQDLIANAWYNHAEIPNNGVDDDGNGYVDDYRGWSPNNNNDNVYGGGHGTQVAGMIGATGNNAQGVAGASWNVKLMVVSNSGANDAGVLASHTYPLVMRRRYNTSNGAEGAFVVATNASWGVNLGQPADFPIWCAMYDSLGSAGVLNCGATSNNNVNVDVVGDMPTACPSDFMISVTATNVDDNRTFSGYGLTTIDVGAPGDAVYTTRINNNYGTSSGTSFASPLTAGVIGLLYSAPCASMMSLVHGDPAAGALYVRDKLFEGVEQVGNLLGQTVTGGRIHAGNSMQLIMNGCGGCPAPYNLYAQSSAISTATIGWTVVAGTTFELRYRPVGAPDWTELSGLEQTSLDLADLRSCAPYEFQVRVDCGDEQSNYSSTFTWTSEGCCTAPSGLARGNVAEDVIHVSWGPVLAADNYDVRYAHAGSMDYTIVADVTSLELDITPLDACTNYSIQVRSNCGEFTAEWSDPIIVRTAGCGICIETQYCISEANNASSEWISLVQLGSIDNATGSDGGYGDHTEFTTDLMVGAVNPFRLEPGYSGFAFNEWFRIWMDLDQDGAFDGPGEMVFDTEGRSNQPVVSSFTLPLTAPLGPTRMRVVMRYNTAPASACEPNYDYGETEDYCVTLVENPGSAIPERSGLISSIHPQPADDRLYFDLATVGSYRNVKLLVFNATGEQVLERQVIGSRNTLNTASFADGLYTYLFLDNGQGIATGRFLVVHAQ